MELGTETLSGDVIDLTVAKSIADIPWTSLVDWVRGQALTERR
jgi:hypothetical protein